MDILTYFMMMSHRQSNHLLETNNSLRSLKNQDTIFNHCNKRKRENEDRETEAEIWR